jgi:hypothetical protein
MPVSQEALNSVALCIIRYLYELASALLKALKNFLLMILGYIDALILQLRALIATYDILAQLEQALWALVESVINEIRDALLGVIEGPGSTCPEFYETVLGPAQNIFEGLVAGLGVFKTRYFNVLSSKDVVEELLTYWEETKATILLLIEVLDDALYQATVAEAQEQLGS